MDTTILDRPLSGTPAALSPAIFSLCEGIAPTHSPQLIEHRPLATSQVRECFKNVADMAAARGGEIVFGWAIWEWPGVFIEAEHHAVWRFEDELIDITPHECPTVGTLFLPDPAAPYDFDRPVRRNNVKRALTKEPAIQAWLDATDELFYALQSRAVGLEFHLSHREHREVLAMQTRIQDLKIEVYAYLANSTGVNDPCFCQSGRKFKKCCARFFR